MGRPRAVPYFDTHSIRTAPINQGGSSHENRARVLATLAIAGLSAACDDNNSPAAPPGIPSATAISATGSITAKVDEYRALLGEPKNGGAAGPQATGRREINWDGVPAQFDNGDNLFPPDFFNTTVKLGAVFATDRHRIPQRQHAVRGRERRRTRTQFGTFSPNKIFAAVGSNVDRRDVPPRRHDHAGAGERARRGIHRRRHAGRRATSTTTPPTGACSAATRRRRGATPAGSRSSG